MHLTSKGKIFDTSTTSFISFYAALVMFITLKSCKPRRSLLHIAYGEGTGAVKAENTLPELSCGRSGYVRSR